ncbi:ABC transporter ATP-binding protein/permease [Synechococcus sp. Cruz CV12-2-Slac-r]|uniref:ABC transporter ATP-binding protein/permease n=1 Tax=Synechococcus sp. Cruz CV12-2-Slac-r TaxID=2823748 RepID=UPI0020CCCCDE|nr:ABC transporter ATP-binding protein/permease [Synechococcus sp. Cruz CV12-2-Slac-r]MCP9940256.1 ABC transporter ATP-binding protein/permease [Synechococcus sp. Cruz CV12-2-Slac-r]
MRIQLVKLQRLAQPYFLPIEDSNPWQFLLLVAALLGIVVGLTLLLLTGLVAASGALIPQLQSRFLPGVPERVAGIWASPAGALVMLALASSIACFVAFRNKLRQGRWLPWLLLGVIALLLLVLNGINVGISFIARNIDNAQVAYDEQGFWRIISIYGFCLILALPIRTLQNYIIPKLGLLWREWLSKRLLDRYMSDRAYYQLNPNDESNAEVDNPDQRISEDARNFTGTSLDFVVGVLEALLTFFSFIIVLWSISKSLTLALIIYAIGGTTLIIFIGRKLVKLNYQQLKLEADFRYGLVHIRDNAESIAFYKGEVQESQEAQRRLGGAIQNFDRLIIWQALINMIRRSYDYLSRFLPWIVIAPIYFAKKVDFGVFSQASIAFGMVFGSVSFIVNNIDQLAAFSASINRLEGFQSTIESLPVPALEAKERSNHSGSILLRDASVVPPGTNQTLVKNINLEVGPSQRVLVVGPSGCGKTSLLRLVSGLWPSGSGEVERPPLGELMFIPQKPYMLLGSLREQLCYPLDQARFSDSQLRNVLEEVNLAGMISRYPDLGIQQDWPRLLSLGEQQRLAFARLLLNSPQFAVLDEATSALDVATERRLYGLLAQRDMAFISVGHRPTLTAFHNTVLQLDGSGGWSLLPAANYVFDPT